MCADDMIGLKYTSASGQGILSIAGLEPNRLVHTRRSDCGTYPQGWQKVFDLPYCKNCGPFAITFNAKLGTAVCNYALEVG